MTHLLISEIVEGATCNPFLPSIPVQFKWEERGGCAPVEELLSEKKNAYFENIEQKFMQWKILR